MEKQLQLYSFLCLITVSLADNVVSDVREDFNNGQMPSQLALCIFSCDFL